MARVFITGSSDGLGRMAAELLIEQGHKVVLHARDDARAAETCPSGSPPHGASRDVSAHVPPAMRASCGQAFYAMTSA